MNDDELIDLLIRERSKRRKKRRPAKRGAAKKAKPMPLADVSWDAIGWGLFLLLAAWLLTSCATPQTYTNPDSSALYGTAGAAAVQETAAANQTTATAIAATQQAQNAATATAESIAAQTTATSESLAFQATEQAMHSQATYNAIAANATGTAVHQLAQAEQRLIADETTRLANQRQNEQVWTIVKVTITILVGSGAAFLLVMLGWRLYNLSRPVEMNDGSGHTVTALPSGQYQIMSGPRRMALPEPSEQIANSAPIDLPRLDKGHVLIVGVTGDGKSMALREIVDHRQNVTVLDPHYTPGAWGQAKAIGGGRDFNAIAQYMTWMQEELTRRSQARNSGQRQFEELTVATEEMPAIIGASDKSARKLWMQWMREGRKFGLFMVVVSQSTRVETMGIKGEGDLLDNFNHVIELASSARKHYPELVAGMERPAVLRSRNQVQPIVIPYDPRRDPESPQFQTALSQHTQTVPTYPMTQINGVPVSPSMIRQIITMKRAGDSNRTIEEEVMGYTGGQAYQIVKQILEQYFDAVNGRLPAF